MTSTRRPKSWVAEYRRETERVVTVWDGRRAWNVPRGPVVYFVGTCAHISRLVKIGRTLTLQARLDQLRNGSPVPLHLLAVVRNYGRTEEAMHEAFASLRAHGEWFDFGDDPIGTIEARLGDLERYAALAALPPLKADPAPAVIPRDRRASPSRPPVRLRMTDEEVGKALAAIDLPPLAF